MTDHRFEAIENEIKRINERLDRGDKQFEILVVKLDQISDLLKHWRDAKGFMATMKNIWALAKWVGFGGAVAWAIYSFGKHGEWRWPIP